ncbi:MAG TPA: FAD-dependent monooxygenase, partial [Sphingomicrobium sp.]|nr:FAD-dependent monooxygenase [Sphingomicrobium sp.]
SVNLGWKLAQVVKGASTGDLLDTYHSEQQPVAARVLRNTMAQVALLGRLDDRKAALRTVFAELLAMEEPRRGFGAAMSGLDIHYALGAGHPLIGRRMPDLDLEARGATRRLTSFLHEGRAVLLDLGIGGRPDVAPWADRLQLVEAAPVASWEIPVVGAIPPAAGVLVRPDGHVAWVEGANDETLQSSLTRWLGDPAKVAG